MRLPKSKTHAHVAMCPDASVPLSSCSQVQNRQSFALLYPARSKKQKDTLPLHRIIEDLHTLFPFFPFFPLALSQLADFGNYGIHPSIMKKSADQSLILSRLERGSGPKIEMIFTNYSLAPVLGTALTCSNRPRIIKDRTEVST